MNSTAACGRGACDDIRAARVAGTISTAAKPPARFAAATSA